MRLQRGYDPRHTDGYPARHMEPEPAKRVLWSFGFRPFFLLAGLYGSVMVLWWIAVLAGPLPAPAALPPTWWHAHEMVFGFVAAAVAGFLLTSVPNWRRARRCRAPRFAALASLWLIGRIALETGRLAELGLRVDQADRASDTSAARARSSTTKPASRSHAAR